MLSCRVASNSQQVLYYLIPRNLAALYRHIIVLFWWSWFRSITPLSTTSQFFTNSSLRCGVGYITIFTHPISTWFTSNMVSFKRSHSKAVIALVASSVYDRVYQLLVDVLFFVVAEHSLCIICLSASIVRRSKSWPTRTYASTSLQSFNDSVPPRGI